MFTDLRGHHQAVNPFCFRVDCQVKGSCKFLLNFIYSGLLVIRICFADLKTNNIHPRSQLKLVNHIDIDTN